MNKIKVGIFGAGRGMDLARNFMLLGCDVVAICDHHTERREKAVKSLDHAVAVYDNFDEFIEHGMDVMVLANYFHEHAPYAIRCFEKGIHVFSECISNSTMAEGIQLLRAFEKSKSIYMLAENYPQMKFNREIKRICDGGSLGKLLYAEGEYNHPGDPRNVRFKKQCTYFEKHWRNYLPRTYYLTHSLGPIMWATGATPKKVTAFSVYAPIVGDFPSGSHNGDRVSIITTQNDDGTVFHFTGNAGFGAHHNSYRVCGTDGQVENSRGMGDQVMLRYNEWTKPTPETRTASLYMPEWNDPDEEKIKKSGHGGADYLTARMFLDCIRENRQPEHPFDIYSAVNMSSVGILAQRSVLNGGKTYDIPDFRNEADCAQYENDYESPFYYSDGREPTIPCCSDPSYKPTDTQLRLFREMVENDEI